MSHDDKRGKGKLCPASSVTCYDCNGEFCFRGYLSPTPAEHAPVPAETVVTCGKCSEKYWIKAENNWWWFEHLYRCPHCQEPFKEPASATSAQEPKGLPPYPRELVAGCKWPACDCLGRWDCAKAGGKAA